MLWFHLIVFSILFRVIFIIAIFNDVGWQQYSFYKKPWWRPDTKTFIKIMFIPFYIHIFWIKHLIKILG